MIDKSDEINAIFDLQIDNEIYLQKIINKYKKYLEGFIYAQNITDLYEKINLFIRYISINGKIGWGGFLYKIENNEIWLINKNKKIWKINFNTNYVFYIKIIKNNNDKTRDIFIKFLSDIDNY
jgi:hypothetical protein